MKEKKVFKYHLKDDVLDDLSSFAECCVNCEDCPLFLNLTQCGYE